MALVELQSNEDFLDIIAKKDKVILFKNSMTCPISETAFSEFEKFADQFMYDTFYYLHVQQARQFSSEVAKRFQIKHESPQVLLFKNGNVIWHDSHSNITQKTLTENWENK